MSREQPAESLRIAYEVGCDLEIGGCAETRDPERLEAVVGAKLEARGCGRDVAEIGGLGALDVLAKAPNDCPRTSVRGDHAKVLNL